MRDDGNNVEAGEGVFPMTWDVDGGGGGGGGGVCGRLSAIAAAAEEETSLASLHRLSRSMPNLAELRQLRERIYEVRIQSFRQLLPLFLFVKMFTDRKVLWL